MSFTVKFWGTRGSIATPGPSTQKFGGNTSCVEIDADGALFICDAGTGARELGVALIERGRSPIVAHMFFSHVHWDHIQGFPFFGPAYLESSHLYVYSVEHGPLDLYKLLSGQMDSHYFPVKFPELGANIIHRKLKSGSNLIEGVEVRYSEQVHPGTSYAYSFEKDGNKIVYATDNEIDLALLNKDEAERHPDELRAAPQPMLDFARAADLLIADGQYTDDVYPGKKGWGHPRATTVVDFAIAAGVRQLAIYHHDPMETDAAVERKVELCRARARRLGGELSIFAAREGLAIKIE